MKGNIPFFAVKRYLYFKAAVLLCLLCSLVMSACVTNIPTHTPTPTMAIPLPTINAPNGRCELAPGGSILLAVTGVSVSGVTYSWSASRGNVTPSVGPSVLYTAPDTGGDDIVRVEARMYGQSSAEVIICVVSTPVTITPAISPTPTVTLTSTITQTVIGPTPTDYPELKVDFEIVPCYKGKAKIKITLYPTGGDGEYLYTASQVFNVQIDDTIRLVVTSGDGQVWAKPIYISRNLMGRCISEFNPGNRDGNEDGNGDGGVVPLPPY